MAVGLDVVHHLGHVALGVDQERRALDAQYVLPANFFSPQTPYFSATSCSGSASSVNGSENLFLNFDVRRLVVRADAENDRAALLELGVRVPETARLDRAAGRVVLGIEVEDDGLSPKV